MQRRAVLVSGAALTSALAGCTGTPSGDDDETYTRVRDREGELEEDDIVFDSTEIVEPDSTEDGHPMFYAVARNEGDVLAENVELTVEFYDAEGSVLFERTVDADNIGPGSIERLHLPFPSDVSADDVEDYELSWSQSTDDGED